jgi:hypothetical protein
LSAEKPGLAGKEIRSINGVPSEEIVKTMLFTCGLNQLLRLAKGEIRN